jgi:hypothetical protein
MAVSEGWRLSDAGARAALAAVVASLALAAGAVDLAGATGGGFWSDAATYYSAALRSVTNPATSSACGRSSPAAPEVSS